MAKAKPESIFVRRSMKQSPRRLTRPQKWKSTPAALRESFQYHSSRCRLGNSRIAKACKNLALVYAAYA